MGRVEEETIEREEKGNMKVRLRKLTKNEEKRKCVKEKS